MTPRSAIVGLLLLMAFTPAWADVTFLRCRGADVDTHEPQDIAVALDIDGRRVLDFGQGDGVETTDFTATTIKARLDPTGAQKNKHFRIQIRRLDGSFTMVSREDPTEGPSAPETRIKGTCDLATRKF